MEGVRSLIRAYMLLTLFWSRSREVLDSERRSIKRIAVYNMLKRERLRFKRIVAASKTPRNRRWWVRPIFLHRETYGAWYALIPTMREFDAGAFLNFLRMTPESFDFLLNKVTHIITKISRRKHISAGERLAITLRYLASGDSFVSLSYLFRVADCTISTIIIECTAAIWYAIKDDTFEPLTQNFWRRKAAEFESMWQFPMCAGAIDGKHCFVQKFPMRGSEHYNYKFGNSVILFAVSDAKYKFIVVDVGARGRESDGGIFDRSEFGKLFKNHELQLPSSSFNESVHCHLPYVFVGDDAFPLDTHLMKGFDNTPGYKPEEIIFNYRLSRARRVVENAFGILSARFRVLRSNIIGSETLVQNVILATTALHNLHLSREDSLPPKQRVYLPPGFADVCRANGKIKMGRWRNEDKTLEKVIFNKLVQHEQQEDDNFGSAFQIREKIMELFVKCSIPSQFDEL